MQGGQLDLNPQLSSYNQIKIQALRRGEKEMRTGSGCYRVRLSIAYNNPFRIPLHSFFISRCSFIHLKKNSCKSRLTKSPHPHQVSRIPHPYPKPDRTRPHTTTPRTPVPTASFAPRAVPFRAVVQPRKSVYPILLLLPPRPVLVPEVQTNTKHKVNPAYDNVQPEYYRATPAPMEVEVEMGEDSLRLRLLRPRIRNKLR